MALERKFLEEMGLTEVQVQAIIDRHVETVKGLIARAETAEKAAENTPAVIKERDDLKKQIEELQKAGDAAKIKKDFDDYKTAVEAEKTAAKKKTAMRALLKDGVGIKREKALDLIMAAEKLDGYELGENDQFKDADSIIKAMKEKHADWIGEVEEKGVPPLNPPGGGGTKLTKDQIRGMTPEQINANWDSVKAALAQKGA